MCCGSNRELQHLLKSQVSSWWRRFHIVDTHINCRSACYIHTHSRSKLYYGTACMVIKDSTGCIWGCHSWQHRYVHQSVIFVWTHVRTFRHTHTWTHPCTHWIYMCYIQKEVWVCTASLATNTIAICNSPINTKTCKHTNILQHYTYVSPFTIIQWTYVALRYTYSGLLDHPITPEHI